MVKNINFSLIFVLLLFSCNTKNDNQRQNNVYIDNQKSLKFCFNFPDTIHINKKYDGEILYKNILDTITTKFDDNSSSSKYRYILYGLVKTNNIDYDFKYLKKIIKDTFGAVNCHKIPIYSVKFNKLGKQYIDGIINDYVSYDTDKKDKNGEIISRVIEVETRATKEVYVIP